MALTRYPAQPVRKSGHGENDADHDLLIFCVMPDYNNHLVSIENLLDQEIYRRSIHQTNFWAKAVPRAVFENRLDPKVITFEPTTPANDSDWEAVALNDGSGSTTPQTAVDLAFAQTVREYGLARRTLQSPVLALDDIRLSHNFKDQLEACFDMCTQNTMREWEIRNRREYVRLAAHKVIIKSGFTESPTAFPTSSATGRVTGQIMKKYYREMINLNAQKDGGMVDTYKGAPQFIAVMSPELDEAIVRGDYEVREDFRQSERSDELLAALGVDRPYNGFYHVIDHKAPRWNLTEGAWVEVPFYTTEATTKGNRSVPNPAYATATHEDTILFLKSCYECQVPAPLSRPGGNTEFDPNTYQGEWKWINFGHNETNPDRDFGRYRGRFYSASKPKYPDGAFVLRGLRPNLVTNLIDANGDIVA